MDENKANDQIENTGSEQPLFSLKFRIPLEDYIQFHLVMGAESVKKGRKKTVLIGWVELVFGVAFLLALLAQQIEGSGFFYVVVAIMILMGLYSILYYRYFYKKSLRRVLTKQHAATPYLQSDILLDFYEDKLTEHVGEQKADTPWESIREIKSTDSLFLVMLDTKRCLLIPKDQLSPEELEKLETLLEDVSKKYRKPRYAV